MASGKSSNGYFNTEMFKNFTNFQGNVPFDFQDLMALQQKSFQAFGEAQQIAMENLQAIAQKQAELFSELMEDNSKFAQDIAKEKLPQDVMNKQADLVKTSCEKSMAKMQTIAQMVGNSSQQASEMMTKQIAETMQEMRTASEKSMKQFTGKAA